MNFSASPFRQKERPIALLAGKSYAAASCTAGSVFSSLRFRWGTSDNGRLSLYYTSGRDGESGRSPLCTHVHTFFSISSSTANVCSKIKVDKIHT